MHNLFADNISSDPRFFFSVVITVIVSICLHELSHGIAAIWQGDRTPIETGHMTLNPLVHMGGMSMIMLLLAGISWGAMPVTPSRMRGKYSDVLVSAAGPLCNVVLAVLAIGSLGIWIRNASAPPTDFYTNSQNFLWLFGKTNIALTIFNLIPVPPLDGSRILAGIVPAYADLLERMVRTGMIGIAFLVLFWFSGSYIYGAAEKVSMSMLQHVVLFHWVFRL